MKEEWDRFHSFMLNCEQYYLEHGLKNHDFKNLETRRFIKATSFDFYDWANVENLPGGVQLYKKEKFEELV